MCEDEPCFSFQMYLIYFHFYYFEYVYVFICWAARFVRLVRPPFAETLPRCQCCSCGRRLPKASLPFAACSGACASASCGRASLSSSHSLRTQCVERLCPGDSRNCRFADVGAPPSVGKWVALLCFAFAYFNRHVRIYVVGKRRGVDYERVRNSFFCTISKKARQQQREGGRRRDLGRGSDGRRQNAKLASWADLIPHKN